MRHSKFIATSVFIALTFTALTALAQQEGSLQYAPEALVNAAIPVPLGNPILLGILTLLTASLAIWKLYRRGEWRTFWVVTAVVLVGLNQLPAVVADRVDIALDNPAGGTVPVPQGLQRYINETQVVLKISSLQPPCPDGVDFASTACIAGTTRLASGEACETNYACPGPELCDGLDNDLNDLIDDALTPPEASCASGNWVCNGIAGWACEVCVANCSGKACGDDGCGGSCGTCGAGQSCDGSGLCVNT